MSTFEAQVRSLLQAVEHKGALPNVLTNRNSTAATTPAETPWLKVPEAAERARCGVKTVYREVKAGRLKAARLGGRRELRFQAVWVDEWLTDHCTIGPSS